MFCRNCGTKIDSEEVLFCMNCGVKFSDISIPKFCTNCGTEIDNNSNFCVNCGKSIPESKVSRIEKIIAAVIIAFIFIILIASLS